MNAQNRDYLMELKGGHKTVARLLEEIKDLIQKKDTQGIAAHMGTLKSGLLSHLKKEDDKLYRDLLKEAKDKNIEFFTDSIQFKQQMMLILIENAIQYNKTGQINWIEDIKKQQQK